MPASFSLPQAAALEQEMSVTHIEEMQGLHKQLSLAQQQLKAQSKQHEV